MNSLSYKILILSSILSPVQPQEAAHFTSITDSEFFLAGGFLYIIRINAQHISKGTEQKHSE